MAQAVKRAYMNYLNNEQKYEKRNNNKKNMAEQRAATGLLAPRTNRNNQKSKSSADEFQSIYDAIQMIRNRGS